MSIIISNPGPLANELKVINHLNCLSASILYKAYITQPLTGQMLQLWRRMLFLASANHDLLFFIIRETRAFMVTCTRTSHSVDQRYR